MPFASDRKLRRRRLALLIAVLASAAPCLAQAQGRDAAAVPSPGPAAWLQALDYTISDPLYAYDTTSANRHQWSFAAVKLPQAFQWTRGRVVIGAADTGVPGLFRDDGLNVPAFRAQPHPDLEPNLRRHLSYLVIDLGEWADAPRNCNEPAALGYQWGVTDNGLPDEYGPYVGHGTHVAGIMAAVGNNGIGVSGSCPGCGLVMMRSHPIPDLGCMAQALQYAAHNGVGVMNFSWGTAQPEAIAPAAIDAAADYDVFMTAAAGNLVRQSIDFPASHPKVAGITGLAPDEGDTLRRPRLWDEFDNLRHMGVVDPPAQRCRPDVFMGMANCGTNIGPGTALAAPAVQILSTLTEDYIALGTAARPAPMPPCTSHSDPLQTQRYGVCSGTSMAAPLVAGVAGLVRSINPLLSLEETRRALTQTATSDPARVQGYSVNRMGAGLLDAEAAVRASLGTVAGATVFNRLTPLFSLLACNPACADLPAGLNRDLWLFTTSPQATAAAQNGKLYLSALRAADAPEKPHMMGVGRSTLYEASRKRYADIGARIAPAQYRLRHPALNPTTAPGVDPDSVLPQAGASAYLFTTPREPRSGAEIDNATGYSYLVPLLRLSALCKRVRRQVYAAAEGQPANAPGTRADYESRGDATQNCETEAARVRYQFDAIEGYLWRAHLPGSSTPLPQPPGTRKLWRLYNASHRAWALVLEGEQNSAAFAGYAAAAEADNGPALLGYVYPNTDSDGDGLVDGFESTIGTNPQLRDSDCDSRDDGVEFPLARLSDSDPLQSPGCGSSTRPSLRRPQVQQELWQLPRRTVPETRR